MLMCGRGQHNIVKQFKKTKVQKKKMCNRLESKGRTEGQLENFFGKITASHYFYCMLLYIYIYIYQRRQWHRTPVLLPGKIPWMEGSTAGLPWRKGCSWSPSRFSPLSIPFICILSRAYQKLPEKVLEYRGL